MIFCSNYIFTIYIYIYILILNYCPREIRQGEEIAWYADGETIVRNEHYPSIAYAYGKLSRFL